MHVYVYVYVSVYLQWHGTVLYSTTSTSTRMLYSTLLDSKEADVGDFGVFAGDLLEPLEPAQQLEGRPCRRFPVLEKGAVFPEFLFRHDDDRAA